MKMSVGSLFSGIGGFELGFENTGYFETLWQVENDKYATSVLKKHWPNVEMHDDVRTWPKKTTQPVDVLLAGFPCQDISYAGRGAGLDGERSGLFYEVMRIVRVLGPSYVVLENVAALFTRGMDQVLGSLSAHGYNAEWEVVSAQSVGAPHRRDRVFIIAWDANGEHGNSIRSVQERSLAESGRSSATLRDSYGNSESVGPVDAKTSELQSDLADSSNKQCKGREQETLCGESRLSRKFRRSSTDQREQWAIEPAMGRVANGVPKRMDRLRCLGNAIVPACAEVVAHRVIEIERNSAR